MKWLNKVLKLDGLDWEFVEQKTGVDPLFYFTLCEQPDTDISAGYVDELMWEFHCRHDAAGSRWRLLKLRETGEVDWAISGVWALKKAEGADSWEAIRHRPSQPRSKTRSAPDLSIAACWGRHSLIFWCCVLMYAHLGLKKALFALWLERSLPMGCITSRFETDGRGDAGPKFRFPCPTSAGDRAIDLSGLFRQRSVAPSTPSSSHVVCASALAFRL